jgi:PEP-CTERM motif
MKRHPLAALALAGIAASAITANAAPITYYISATHYVDAAVTPLGGNASTAHEVGFGRQNTAAPGLPAALPKYTANIPLSGVGGTFSFCSADDANCVTGEITNLSGAAPLGIFAHSTSTSVVTGGTGAYVGATGSWNNDAYIISRGGVNYSLYNFNDGNLIANGTNHAIKGGGFVDGITQETQFSETGYKEATLTADVLPSALFDYVADLNVDGTDAAPLSLTTGVFSWCAINGIDCLSGTIANFESLAPRGLWQHTRSVSTVTGGSGVYANTTGSWSNDSYVITYANTGPRYGLFNLAEGRITVNDVPLPGTLALMLIGALGFIRRRIF